MPITTKRQQQNKAPFAVPFTDLTSHDASLSSPYCVHVDFYIGRKLFASHKDANEPDANDSTFFAAINVAVHVECPFAH
jgi:hypothetical protein